MSAKQCHKWVVSDAARCSARVIARGVFTRQQVDLAEPAKLWRLSRHGVAAAVHDAENDDDVVGSLSSRNPLNHPLGPTDEG